MVRPYRISAGLKCFAAAVLAVVIFLQLAPSAIAKERKIVATISQIGDPLGEIIQGQGAVDSLMGEGVDPHLYRPTRSDIAKLTRADLILYNGLSLEAQLLRPIAQLKGRVESLAIAEALDGALWLPYANGPGDPHVWMDPSLWRQALEGAVEFIAKSDADHGAEYRKRAGAYFERMRDFEAYADQAMGSIPQERRILVTAHDAFSYFGRRFGIEVRGIQGISTESEAGLRAIEDLVDLLVERKVPAVFVETSVSDRHVRALIEGARARGHYVVIGGSLYSDAMGAPGTYEGTYLGMIDHNVTVIARALGGSAPERGWQGKLAAPNAD